MILSSNAGIAAIVIRFCTVRQSLIGNNKINSVFQPGASNAGVTWWSHDIGGYHKGIEDNELYIRFGNWVCLVQF